MFFKKDFAIFKRCPVRRSRNKFSEIWLSDIQDKIMRQVIGQLNTFPRIFKHPEYSSNNTCRYLESSSVLAGRKRSCLLNTQRAARPPGIIKMPHQERPQSIFARYNFISHYPDPGLEFIIPAAQFPKRGKRIVTWHISIIYGRPIDRPAIFPDCQPVRKTECFTVPDHHTDNFFIRYPRSYPCINAHLWQENLVLRSAWRVMGQGWELIFMCPPTYFSRSSSFFPQSFNAPRPYKFVDLLWSVGNLSVSLAAMDHFNSQFHREAGKIPFFCKVCN